MITSTANAKIKHLVNLKKKKKIREEENVFLTEGIRMFREVPADRLEEVYVSESFYRKERAVLDQVLEGSRVTAEVLSDHVYEYVSDTKTPQGVLCLVRRKECGLQQMLETACPFVLVLDNLQDPGNLGTIVRTAEAAGVTGIILSSDCVDIYNPKTIRSTMGSVYRMPFCYVEDVVKTVGELKRSKISVYAAHLQGRRSYDEEDYRMPCAFLIGNEGNGLRDAVAEQADTYIRIPMQGQAESLNAAVAASVLMFETARQRRH